jgi:hypothetical protein
MALSWSGQKKTISSQNRLVEGVFERDFVVNFTKVAVLDFATFSTFATPLYQNRCRQMAFGVSKQTLISFEIIFCFQHFPTVELIDELEI